MPGLSLSFKERNVHHESKVIFFVSVKIGLTQHKGFSVGLGVRCFVADAFSLGVVPRAILVERAALGRAQVNLANLPRATVHAFFSDGL